MVDIQRAPRCGHAWVVGIDTSLHDGLRAMLPVRVRDTWEGWCPFCGEPATERSGQYFGVLTHDE